MADEQHETTPPPGARWRLIGPGLVAAATGVGAGDLVATLVAGSKFGYALLWAAVIGTLLKISLAEAVGRWSLASGRTIFEGWSSLGPGWFGGRLNWASVYFGLYVVIWGFVYGATAMTASALPAAALLDGTPLALSLKVWAMILGVLGLVLVWFNRYPLFEKIMTVLVGVMFITVVGLAVIAAPDLPAMSGDKRSWDGGRKYRTSIDHWAGTSRLHLGAAGCPVDRDRPLRPRASLCHSIYRTPLPWQ